jgi:HPt (histidine-containing phosphotransfer) domain-containing protein
MTASAHPQPPIASDPEHERVHEQERSSPAIDRVNGVARLMGDGALFARVLARFRKEYRHAADGIRSALAAGDVPLAQRLAHTLKGAAGMIEAVPLREEARALEQALRYGDGDHTSRLARLELALERVLHELDAAEGVDPAQPAAKVQAQVQAQGPESGKLTAQLRALLEDGNGDAVDLVQEAAAGLAGELGEECYRQIAAAIDVFDFEGALALLNRRG